MNCPNCQREVTIETTEYFVSEICENCFEYARVEDLNCCLHPDNHKVKLITSAGTIQVREQCRNCGNVKSNNLGGYTKEQREALPLLDLSKRERLQEIKNKAYRDSFDRKSAGRLALIEQQRKDWFREYNLYLQSPEWKQKRQLVMKRDGGLCQSCLRNSASQVHHKSYEFVDLSGSEPCFDLVSICTPCHDRIEEMKRERKRLAQQ